MAIITDSQDASPKPTLGRTHADPTTVDEALDEARPGGNRKPELTYTMDGFTAAYTSIGVEFRLNTRARRVEYCSRKTAGWAEVDDEWRDATRDWLASKFEVKQGKNWRPWRPTKARWRELLNATVWHRQTDPLIDKVAAGPQWDTTKRLATFLATVFDFDPKDPIIRWASTYFFLAPIQRAFEPGCKIDEIPILIGGQGAGKSAFIRSVIWPEHQDEWFGDNVSLHVTPKEQAESLAGRVLCELAELTGIHRADVERIKAFITRQNDGQHRGAYKEYPKSTPRLQVLAGSTNEERCLPADLTGNRRFVPVVVGPAGSRVEDWFDTTLESGDIMRDQLWAEALHLYREGTRANLPRDLHPAQAELAERHRSRDPLLEDAIANLPPQHATLGELMGQAKVKETYSKKFAELLGHYGWKHTRHRHTNGERKSCWIHPDAPQAVQATTTP